jgi:hypothetical protein
LVTAFLAPGFFTATFFDEADLGSVDKFLNRENRFFGIPVFGFAL